MEELTKKEPKETKFSLDMGARFNTDYLRADVNFSIDDMKNTPRKAADPEAIYKDNTTGNLVFRYAIDKQNDAKVVFLPGRKLTSMVLCTFFKTRRGAFDEDSRCSRIYIRSEAARARIRTGIPHDIARLFRYSSQNIHIQV